MERTERRRGGSRGRPAGRGLAEPSLRMAIPEKWSVGAWLGEAGHSSGSGMLV